MPRAKANPEPAVAEHASGTGRTYRIEAFRNGSYAIYFGDKLVAGGPAEVNRGFGSPKWPSNRLQEEAIERAKSHVYWLRDDVG
jgi:hypothetical protein